MVACRIGWVIGTTAMFPLRNCRLVMPCRIPGPDTFHACSRCLRTTAVLMKVAVACLACAESGTVRGLVAGRGGLCLAEGVGAAGADVSLAVRPKIVTRIAITPATRTSTET